MTDPRIEDKQVESGVDVQETLRFIDRVISRSNRLTHSTGLVPITWGVLTAAAIIATWILAITGKGESLSINAVWLVHNFTGWSVTLTHMHRSQALSKYDKQLSIVWVVMTLAIWSVILSSMLAGIPAGWAIMPTIQFLAGIGLAMTGIVVGVRGIIIAGAVLIVTFPAILSVPGWAYLISGVLTTVTILAIGIAARLNWKRLNDGNERG